MTKIVAYASSTRPNHLWSAAQFDNALPKNRTDADIPLVAKADFDALVEDAQLSASGETIMKTDVERMILDWQTECSDHPALHNQGNVLLDRLRALKPSLAMNDFLTGMDALAAKSEAN